METCDTTLEPVWDDESSAETEPDKIHACKILIVDDEETNVRLLERVLTRAGFENFISTTDSREIAALYLEFSPDLVLTDWLMPEVDGCAVIEQIRALTATDEFLPIVVLTADITTQSKKRALLAGATDFLTKPFDQSEVLLRIDNLLKARLSYLLIQELNVNLEESVRLRTIELERSLLALKASQQQVIQQERLAALGTMAGGIAHDFNNALSVIMGFGELLLRDAEHGLTKEAATLPITTILTAAEDAAKIVHRLSEFYRPGEAEELRVQVDLNQLVEQVVNLTQPRCLAAASALGSAIVIATKLGQIPFITADAAELREALTNLIFNAVDALPHGGTITLGTYLDGEVVALEISDTGIGMSDETRQRCLEPFFTTKGQKGTGLGLSMVFGIVHRHHGIIDIVSELGAGTTFSLRFPSSEPDPAAADVPPPSRSLRILVVDDQLILSQVVCEYLLEDLHAVATTLSGSEALERFHTSDFDLVITDQSMPGMSGEQLAVAIKELSPETPVLMLTGHGGPNSSARPWSSAIDLVIGKPVSRATLRKALAAVTAA